MDFYNDIDDEYVPFTIELFKGEYNASKLFTAIKNIIIDSVFFPNGATNPDVQIFSNGNQDIADLETPYLKIESNIKLKFRFDLLPTNNNINSILGFERKEYISDDDAPWILLAPYVYNLGVNDKLFIEIDAISEISNSSSTNVLQNVNLNNIQYGSTFSQYYPTHIDNIKEIWKERS